MKMSWLLVPTMKDNPAQVNDPGLSAMMRRGYASFSSEGNRLSLLPLGVRVRERLFQLLEKNMGDLKFQPVSSSLRHDSGMTIAEGNIQSYRHLPFNLIEVTEEDVLLSGYSRDFYKAEEELKVAWNRLSTLFQGIGLEIITWKDVSPYGQRYCLGVVSGKGDFRSEKGLACSDSKCCWHGTSNSFVPFSEYYNPDPGQMEEVHTPGVKTIADLCSFLSVESYSTVKTMLFVPEEDDPGLVAVLIRGDRNVNETKLAAHLGVRSVRAAISEEIGNILGDTEGFLGPVGLPEGIRIVADKSVEGATGVVVGANRKDYHFEGACWGRDFQVHSMADLSKLEVEHRCPGCGEELKEIHVTRLCEMYIQPGPRSRLKDLSYLDESNEPVPTAFWRGKIHVLPVIVASFRQESSLPFCLAPFRVMITIPSTKNHDALKLADRIGDALTRKGCPVLIDDREIRGGVKFADAEILHLPFTIVVGRGASEDKVELWLGDGRREEVDADLAVDIISGGNGCCEQNEMNR